MTRGASRENQTPPGPKEIEKTLGRTAALWTRLHAELSGEFGPLLERWTWNPRTGHWVLQIKRAKGKRTILYLVLCPKHFQAAFALGEKACRAAPGSGLPTEILELIDKARRWPEGRDVRLEVRTRKALDEVMDLARIKMAN